MVWLLMARGWKSCCLKLAALGVLLMVEILRREAFLNAPVQPSTVTEKYPQPPTNTEKHPQPPTHTNLTDHPQPPTSSKRHPRPPNDSKNSTRPPTNTEKLVQQRQEMDRQMLEYPLSVNLSDVVDKILSGESPKVKPVHNITKYAYLINPVQTCSNSTVTWAKVHRSFYSCSSNPNSTISKTVMPFDARGATNPWS